MSQADLAGDAAQREEALRPDTSFLVSAPAGSGKTEVLVQRVLRLLATVEEPEEILAITFTRKAEAEMHRRILGALDRAAESRGDDKQEQTLELARAALARDKERGWHLREQPWRLGVRTIDGFCRWLGVRMPVLSGLGGQVGIDQNPEDLYQEAALRLFDEMEGDEPGAAEDLETLLASVHNRQEAAMEFLVDFLAHRNRRLHLLPSAAADARDELRAELEESRRLFASTQYAAARQILMPWGDAIMRLGAAAARRVGADSPIHVLAERQGELPQEDDGAAWQGIAALLLTGSGSWRKRVDKWQGFPPQCPEKEEITKILTALCAACEPRPLALLQVLPADPAFGEAQWRLLAACSRLQQRAAGHLRVVFQESGKIDYPQLTAAAQEALYKAPGLALRLGCGLHHILVDEFQDTSRIQVQLLERLIQDWQAGEGASREHPCSLFLVGDAMQSCYRFRGAELELFLHVAHNGLGDLKLRRLQLGSNFRSGSGLVEWSNRCFGQLLREQDDAAADSITYSPAQAQQDFPTAHSAELFVSPKDEGQAAEEAQAQRAVALIAEVRAEKPDAHIAVLARNRAHMSGVIEALRQKGLQWLAEDVDPLAERPAVRDLMMLVRALMDPADRLAWLALLRTPWCGLDDRALHSIAAGDASGTVWDAVCAGNPHLAQAEQARLARLAEALAPAVASYGRVSLRRLTEGAWLALGGPACLEEGAEQEQDVLDFLQLVDELEAEGPLLAEQLEQRVQKLYAAPNADGESRLHLMTIHKAKGLEFDTVILYGLNRQLPSDRSSLLEFGAWMPPQGGEEKVLAAVSLPGEEDGMAAILRQQETEKQSRENLRLVYVGMTRAVRRLHLLACMQEDSKGEIKPKKNSLLAQVWDAMELDFEKIPVTAQAEEAEEEQELFPVAVPTLRRLPGDWRLPAAPPAMPVTAVPPPPAPPAADEFEMGAGADARYAGIVLHEALELMAQQGLHIWDDRARAEAVWRARLREYGVTGGKADQAAETIAQGVRNTVQDEQGRRLLTAADAEAELTLSTLDESGRLRRLRADRTFLADGERWVVDYKSSAPGKGETRQDFLRRQEALYRDQLLGYVRIFQQIEPDRRVRAALYFPLLPGLDELSLELSE